MRNMQLISGWRVWRSGLAALLAAFAAMAPLAADEPEVAPASETANPDPIALAFTLDVTGEYRFRSAEVLVEEATYKNGIDLQRDVLDLPPFAAFDFQLGRKRGLGVGFAAEIRRQFEGDYFLDGNYIPLTDSDNPVAFENPMITKGAIYWRSDSLDLSFGRDKVDFGEGLKGSLYPSIRLPYLDAFRARGRLGRFGVDWLVASIRAEKSWDGYDVDPNEGLSLDDFPLGASTAAADKPYGFQGDANPTSIIEAVHRFTWDFEKLRIGLAGHVMYARRNNYFTVTDFFPIISWHQTTIMSNNMSLLADFSWYPADGLRIMGMGGFDEINAGSVGVADSGSPTVPAWVLGADYRGRIGAGPLHLYAEAGYTHYLWGNYDGSTDEPNDVDPLARAQYRLYMDAGAGLLPLTSPYGPGATWGRIDGSVEIEAIQLEAGLGLLVLSKIKSANLVTTEVLSALPDDSRFLFVEVDLPLKWAIGNFDFNATPALCARDSTWWTEFTVGAAYHLRLSRDIGQVIR